MTILQIIDKELAPHRIGPKPGPEAARRAWRHKKRQNSALTQLQTVLSQELSPAPCPPLISHLWKTC